MAADRKEAADQGTKNPNPKSRSNRRIKVKLYREKEKRWVKDKNEIEKLEERCSESIDTSSLQRFLDFPISKRTFQGLKKAGYETPTEIQREAIVLALKGLDILGAAKTGSGKTLAFLIPVLEILYRNQWTHLDGLGALIVAPVRELASQIFHVLKEIGNQHEFSAALVIGGKDLRIERPRIKACNIIICTPGRLLQHMNENLDCSNLKVLVLDEADRILDMGFGKEMDAIIENLPQERQTLMFSATQTRSVKDLARLSLRDPVYVSVHEHSIHSTPEGLRQSYIVCELHEKLNTLWSFIKSNLKQKILVFMTTCKQVKFTYELFCRMKPGMSVMALHGSMHQLKRMAIYDEFRNKSHAVLIATDIAARGLDFPTVNWVMQMDCPDSVNTYIHRAGRTARYEEDGESVLVLLPSEEEAMVAQLEQKKIPIKKIKVRPDRQQSIQRKVAALIARDVALKETAQRAFTTYIKAMFLMKDKNVFDIKKLDMDAYAHSLGLGLPPRLNYVKKKQKLQEAREAERLSLEAKKHEKKLADKLANSRKEDQVSSSSESSSEEEESDDAEEEESDDAEEDSDSKTQVPKPVNEFAAFHVDDSDEDLFTVKRRIMPSDVPSDEDLSPLPEYSLSSRYAKPVTKAAIAKKMLKKNIQANQKVVFDDDGEVVEDALTKQSSKMAKEAARDQTDRGIDIAKAMAVMQEEDKVDKELYRQKIKAKHKAERLKEKERKNRHKAEEHEEDEEDSQTSDSDEAASVDLDFLPDPDKVYSKADAGSDDEDETSESESDSESGQSESGSESSSSESDAVEIPDTRKRKPGPKAAVAPKKRMRSKGATDADAPMDTGLSLVDDEELALHFLKNYS